MSKTPPSISINARQCAALLELADSDSTRLRIQERGEFWHTSYLEVVQQRGSDSLGGTTYIVDAEGGYHRLPDRR